MLAGLKKLFSSGPKVDYAELVAQGAVIIDVRSKGEYAGGHIKGSVNIPLDSLGTGILQAIQIFSYIHYFESNLLTEV